MRLARGLVPAATAAAVAGALLAACGGSDTAQRRDAVNAYFDEVGRAQSPIAARAGEINEALGSFSPVRATPARARALARAAADLRAAARRVRAIDAPPDAARLHESLLTLLELQAALAAELVATGRYVDGHRDVVRPLAAASTALTDDLRTARDAAATSAAFARYRGSLQRVLARLSALRAPSLLRPGHESERRTLRRSVALCSQVVAALAAGDVPAANKRIGELLAVSAQAGGKATRKAELAAVRAYNAKRLRIATLAARVARQRTALVEQLGD